MKWLGLKIKCPLIMSFFSLFGISCFCNHLRIIAAITALVNEHEPSNKHLQSNICRYRNIILMLKMFMAIMTWSTLQWMPGRSMPSNKQQNYQINQFSHLSDLTNDPYFRILYRLLLLWSNSWALATSSLRNLHAPIGYICTSTIPDGGQTWWCQPLNGSVDDPPPIHTLPDSN